MRGHLFALLAVAVALASLPAEAQQTSPTHPPPATGGSHVISPVTPIGPSHGCGALCVLQCFLYGCDPVINTTLFGSKNTPGGVVLIGGSGFGSEQGRVMMRYKTWKGAQQFVTLPVLAWGDSFAEVQVPATFTGALDQDSTYQVYTVSGQTSNQWTVHFTAKRDFQTFPLGLVNCSTSVGAGSSDRCQTWGQANTPIECFKSYNFGTMPVDTIDGFHASGWGGGNRGNDGFNGTVANGWVFDSHSPLYVTTDGDGEGATIWQDMAFGQASFNMSVVWNVNACGVTLYYAEIYITGPADVPYH